MVESTWNVFVREWCMQMPAANIVACHTITSWATILEQSWGEVSSQLIKLRSPSALRWFFFLFATNTHYIMGLYGPDQVGTHKADGNYHQQWPFYSVKHQEFMNSITSSFTSRILNRYWSGSKFHATVKVLTVHGRGLYCGNRPLATTPTPSFKQSDHLVAMHERGTKVMGYQGGVSKSSNSVVH